MKYLKLYEDFDNITFDVKTRYSYEGMRFSHEYFTIRINNKIVSSCIIIYPKLYSKEYKKDKFNTWSIYTGCDNLFTYKDDKFVKLYYVKSRKDGKGYGRILFEKLKEYLKSKGKNRIYLDVDINNKGAHEFYKKIGFKEYESSFSSIGYVLNF